MNHLGAFLALTFGIQEKEGGVEGQYSIERIHSEMCPPKNSLPFSRKELFPSLDPAALELLKNKLIVND